MKLCVPTNDQMGLDSHLALHFGTAPFYLLVDSDSKDFDFIENTKRSAHQHGHCYILSRLKRRGVEGIIAKSLGRGVWYKAKEQNTKLFKAEHETIRSTLHAFIEQSLSEMSWEDACHHSHKHSEQSLGCH